MAIAKARGGCPPRAAPLPSALPCPAAGASAAGHQRAVNTPPYLSIHRRYKSWCLRARRGGTASSSTPHPQVGFIVWRAALLPISSLAARLAFLRLQPLPPAVANPPRGGTTHPLHTRRLPDRAPGRPHAAPADGARLCGGLAGQDHQPASQAEHCLAGHPRPLWCRVGAGRSS